MEQVSKTTQTYSPCPIKRGYSIFTLSMIRTAVLDCAFQLNRNCPPPPAKTKPRIVSMVPVKNCCEATEAWLIALSRVVGLYALYIMVHVRSLRTCPVLAEASFVTFTLAAKWRFVLFVDDSLLDLVIRCKDRDLTRIDAQDTVVAGLQAALIVTAFERLREI